MLRVCEFTGELKLISDFGDLLNASSPLCHTEDKSDAMPVLQGELWSHCRAMGFLSSVGLNLLLVYPGICGTTVDILRSDIWFPDKREPA